MDIELSKNELINHIVFAQTISEYRIASLIERNNELIEECEEAERELREYEGPRISHSDLGKMSQDADLKSFREYHLAFGKVLSAATTEDDPWNTIAKLKRLHAGVATEITANRNKVSSPDQ